MKKLLAHTLLLALSSHHSLAVLQKDTAARALEMRLERRFVPEPVLERAQERARARALVLVLANKEQLMAQLRCVQEPGS